MLIDGLYVAAAASRSSKRQQAVMIKIWWESEESGTYPPGVVLAHEMCSLILRTTYQRIILLVLSYWSIPDEIVPVLTESTESAAAAAAAVRTDTAVRTVPVGASSPARARPRRRRYGPSHVDLDLSP